MSRLAILFGASNAALAIILGAFAAHGLEDSLSERMQTVFNTAVDYHLYHALGLILLGSLLQSRPNNKLIHASIYTMFAGILIFCGSLYILSLSGITWLGMITPIGGIAFILSWLLLALAFIKK